MSMGQQPFFVKKTRLEKGNTTNDHRQRVGFQLKCKHKNTKEISICKKPKIVHGYCLDCGSHNVEGVWLTAQEIVEAINPKETV